MYAKSRTTQIMFAAHILAETRATSEVDPDLLSKFSTQEQAALLAAGQMVAARIADAYVNPKPLLRVIEQNLLHAQSALDDFEEIGAYG